MIQRAVGRCLRLFYKKEWFLAVSRGTADAWKGIMLNADGVVDGSMLDLDDYALLPGRSGGQNLRGGTAASENLTLESTSHATKGDIILISEAVHVDDGWLEINRSITAQDALWIRLYRQDGEKARIGLSSNDYLSLSGSNDSTPDVVVDTSGNVGIGPATPGAKLDVDGDIKINGNWLLQSETEGGVERLTLRAVGVNSAAELFLHPTGSATTSRITITDGVNTVNYAGIAVESTTTEVTIESVKAGTGTAQPIKIKMDGVDIITILAGGNVRFDNTLLAVNRAPTSGVDLDVNGTLMTRAELAFGGNIATPSRSAFIYRPANHELAFGTNSLERMKIDASGDVTVSETLVASRLPALLTRQGGSATSWLTAGTTDQSGNVDQVRMQVGTINVSVTSGVGAQAVTFPEAFDQAPIVTATHVTGGSSFPVGLPVIMVQDLTASGFTMGMQSDTGVGSGTYAVSWIAIGAR